MLLLGGDGKRNFLVAFPTMLGQAYSSTVSHEGRFKSKKMLDTAAQTPSVFACFLHGDLKS